jgi:thioredoxin 1
MPASEHFANPEPTRAEIDALPGVTVLEFGTAWCGYCIAAQPAIATALAEHPSIRHIKVEDGSGRPLGRSFKVKLWPTLILVVDGVEVARVVRPTGVDQIQQTLSGIASS